jgi:hypothetical protein
MIASGKFEIEFPKKIELVKDVYGYWGKSSFSEQKEIAQSLPLKSGD